jgi:ABC-type phosphate transport system substrate-binding protein
MKITKFLLVLAIAFFASVSHANAQASIQFLGGGSSALYVELGQAAIEAAGGTGTACSWSLGKNANILARDARTTTPTDEQGNVWVVWTAGTGTCTLPTGAFNVWSYMSLDSTVGDRCYFENDGSGTPGCVQVMTVANTVAGANKLCYPSVTTCTFYKDNPGTLPSAVSGALNGQHYFVIGTDIRPEDAKFATFRLLQPCDAAVNRQPFDQIVRQVQGLGYGPGPVGTQIKSFYSGALFNVIDFNITGNDPIKTTQPVPAFTVLPVGAQPIVVAVGPNDTTHNGLNVATDIPMYVLMNFYDGALGRASDVSSAAANWGVTTLVREPLSGTYNVFEYSAINNSQFHDSQDAFNCNAGTGAIISNPMNLLSINGQPANGSGQQAFRRRVIGTGEMVAQLQNASDTDDRLGYFFWSAGNASGLTNVKYLTVNGVDPLLDAYTNGTLPGSGGPSDPGITKVTFKNLNAGDYPIWSPVRLVTRAPFTTNVQNLLTSLNTLNSTNSTAPNDFISLANLKIWHSHYSLPAIGVNTVANGVTVNPATAGDLCNATGALAEAGGDAGGANIFIVANHDFCADFSNVTGLVNKTN